jgi:hypothetical protein
VPTEQAQNPEFKILSSNPNAAKKKKMKKKKKRAIYG